MRDFRKLEVWNLGMALVPLVYMALENLSDKEGYGLKSQISGAAVSIPSNIAEGCSRTSKKEFIRYLEISLGSAFELETQIIICERLSFLDAATSKNIIMKLIELQKKCSSFRSIIKSDIK